MSREGGVQNLAITKERKSQLIETYVSLLGDSQAVVFVGAQGLTVAEVSQLRAKIRETGATYHMVKNTLFERALTQMSMPVPEFIKGPVSIAYCVEDIAPVVKAIQDFANILGERAFKITGSIVDNQVLGSEQANALASLPSKATLFAQILAGINAPATQVTGIVANTVRQILNVLQARVDQLDEGTAPAEAA
jgi:large subunit ribosomal protein L10